MRLFSFKPPQKPAAARSIEDLSRSIVAKLTYSVGKSPNNATQDDWLTTTILVVRDEAIERSIESARVSKERMA